MNHYDNLLNLSCDTTIATEKDGYYTFKETVFYGEKGGMPGDKGTINGQDVIDLKWENDILYHKVDGTLKTLSTWKLIKKHVSSIQLYRVHIIY